MMEMAEAVEEDDFDIFAATFVVFSHPFSFN